MKIEFNKHQVLQRIQAGVTHAVKESALALVINVQEKLSRKSSNIGAGGLASTAGEPPALNTGNLRRSITTKDVTENPWKPTWRVGTNAVYARIQEYGGRIKAQHREYLAIPVGVKGRQMSKKAKGNLYSLNLKLVKTKRHNLVLIDPKKKKFKVLFVLKRSVYLPPRPYLRPAFIEEEPRTRFRVANAIAEALKGTVAA